MRPRLIILLTGATLFAACGCGAERPEPPAVELPEIVARGGGRIPGHRVSNSLEALDASYAVGHRCIEIDLAWTSDKHVVLSRAWRSDEDVPTLEQFRANADGLTAMVLEDLVEWMHAHDDAIVVVDLVHRPKRTLTRLAKRAGPLMSRMVPTVRSEDEHDTAKALGFEAVILALNGGAGLNTREAARFAREHRIVAVAMPKRRAAEVHERVARDLRRSGTRLFAYGVNRNDDHEALRARGVDGIFSDHMRPDGSR